MYKLYRVAFALSFGSVQMFAQTSLDQVLKEIERNNPELKAYSKYLESKHLENRSENNLKNPELSFYYLPWGDTPEGTYTEVQLTQQFEFPTVYSTRNKLNIERQQLYNKMFDVKRTDIVSQAEILCIELMYLNQQFDLESQRLNQAENIYNQLQTKYKLEEIGILEFNKAKLNWLQRQFIVDELKEKRKSLHLQLTTLNNGNPINVHNIHLKTASDIADLDKLWADKQKHDQRLLKIDQAVAIARQETKLQKAKGLPQITLGVNQQRVPNSTHFGVYTGLSIPLWANKHKIKAADTYLTYQETQLNVTTNKAYTELKNAQQTYKALFKKYKTFESVLSDINTESLLLESYELGEISFTTYYQDIQLFRTYQDTFLSMEKQLHIMKATILKHLN